MSDWNPIARLLILAGAGLIVLGVVFQIISRVLPNIGRLPGNIVIQRDNFTLYVPLATMLIVSIVLSVVFTLISRWLNNK
jgi:hypothetical protein